MSIREKLEQDFDASFSSQLEDLSSFQLSYSTEINNQKSLLLSLSNDSVAKQNELLELIQQIRPQLSQITEYKNNLSTASTPNATVINASITNQYRIKNTIDSLHTFLTH